MESKKGLSEVVTAILIVLLAVAAVVIVWAVIRPMIQKSSGEVGTSCITLDLEIVEVDATAASSIKIKRNTGEGDIANIKVVFDSGTDSETQDVPVAAEDLDELETKKFTLTAPTMTWASVEEVQIAAEVRTETGDLKICPVSDSMASDLFKTA